MKDKDILRLGIAGASGRVGKLLVQELGSGAWPRLALAFAGGRNSNPEDLFDGTDVVIDFTTPEATARHVWLAAKHRRPIIVGTTGLSAAQEQELHDAARECPVLYAANMSVGVTLLAALVEKSAAALGGWDVQIAETHHKHKKDAPSGTALMLGRASKSNDVGYAVQRGGDVVGEHTVTFYSAGERIALTHIATDRALFARGALKAAIWLSEQPAGLFDMRDALGLR